MNQQGIVQRVLDTIDTPTPFPSRDLFVIGMVYIAYREESGDWTLRRLPQNVDVSEDHSTNADYVKALGHAIGDGQPPVISRGLADGFHETGLPDLNACKEEARKWAHQHPPGGS